MSKKMFVISLLIFGIAINSFNAIANAESTTVSFTNLNPENNSIDIYPSNMALNVTIVNSNGNSMNLTIYSNLSGTWDYFYTGIINTTLSNIYNGTYDINPVFFVKYNNTYYWYINLSEYNNDSNYNKSDIYKFTTNKNSTGYNISVGLTESEADELFLSSAFSLTTESLIMFVWMFFIILGEWKIDWVYKILQLPIGLTYGVTLLGANIFLGLGVIFASIYILAIAYWQGRKKEGEM